LPEGLAVRTIKPVFGYANCMIPESITIEKDSVVMWINQDPAELHGINLIDKNSGKTFISNYPIWCVCILSFSSSWSICILRSEVPFHDWRNNCGQLKL
jgi:hypothetical protein